VTGPCTGLSDVNRESDVFIAIQPPADCAMQAERCGVVERNAGDQRSIRHHCAIELRRNTSSARGGVRADQDDPPGIAWRIPGSRRRAAVQLKPRVGVSYRRPIS